MILVTGGAGFIGSNFVLDWLATVSEPVVNLDALTYAGNLENLSSIADDPRHHFVHGDIGDAELVRRLLREYSPRAIVNFAAESHVDRSIRDPEAFIRTNVVGTYRLLEAAREHWQSLTGSAQESFRFIHVSTDEVYGSLDPDDPPFTEQSPLAPNSPYAASKASGDMLVRAWQHTYGLPAIITNCSNNYGPLQFPEKFIPLVVVNALAGMPLPVYGDGMQVRDWLYVTDHCRAIRRVLEAGRLGETYAIGGGNERRNIDVVKTICSVMDDVRPREDGRSYAEQIAFVTDRPGHDRRYAIDAGKMARELSWNPEDSFDSGIRKTILWYLDHPEWVRRVQSGDHRRWVQLHYGSPLPTS
jgi:dTDP-glucose 4,6-dehydratase